MYREINTENVRIFLWNDHHSKKEAFSSGINIYFPENLLFLPSQHLLSSKTVPYPSL